MDGQVASSHQVFPRRLCRQGASQVPLRWLINARFQVPAAALDLDPVVTDFSLVPVSLVPGLCSDSLFFCVSFRRRTRMTFDL